MIVTCVHVYVKKNFISEFLEATIENHRNSIEEEGNIRFDVLQREENRQMFRTVLQYLKSEGIGFAGDLRENTSYRILNRHHTDDVHIFLDERQEDYYARGEHCHSVVGYFKE